jgi:hypothetical protein
MELQQMMELLLAKMDGRQEEMLARMEAKIDNNQAKTDASRKPTKNTCKKCSQDEH